MAQRRPLYDKPQAECLQWREALNEADRIKYELMLRHVPACNRLADIGCGWGQFLAIAQQRAQEVWGVDDCADRIRDVRRTCPAARMVICRADRLALPPAFFDVVVTSQMLHEVKLFGETGELARTLSEIRRVLAPGGRYLLQDHQDAGEGQVVVRLPDEQVAKLETFERKFEFYQARHEPLEDGAIRISRRCLQDFLTKDHWLGSHMEALEMRETHNVFSKGEICDLVSACGLRVQEWIDFSDIRDDLSRHGGTLVEGEPWTRKFLLIARKA